MGGSISIPTIEVLRASGHSEPVHFFPSAIWPPGHRDTDRTGELSDVQLVERLRGEAGYPAEIFENQELLDLVMSVIRADANVTETWTFTGAAPLQCPITAFSGANDRKVPRATIAGWREHTIGRFQEIEIDGEHDFLQTHSERICAVINSALG